MNKLQAKPAHLPTILFHRSYKFYTGGHGKVWNYFNHVKASGLYQARIHFSSNSTFDNNNPWINNLNETVDKWEPDNADILFLAGMDWKVVPNDINITIPIINLIQGVRHADPEQPLFQFLNRRAIRICVSQAVADAILNTQKVNGPVIVIPNGIDILKGEYQEIRTNKIFIGALKNPDFGIGLSEHLLSLGLDVDLLIDRLPRTEYLTRLGNARIAILLPVPVEGFYLPGLEAMALGTPVIMPDCIGNSEYGKNNINCIITAYNEKEILHAVKRLDNVIYALQLRKAGLETAHKFSFKQEEEKFHEVLKTIHNIWT